MFIYFERLCVCMDAHAEKEQGVGGREGERERERERERILSRPHAQCRAQCGARSHHPEIMTRAKINSMMLNRLSHPGAPHVVHF